MASVLRQRIARFAPLVLVVAVATFLINREGQRADATIEVVAGERAGAVTRIELELRHPDDPDDAEAVGRYAGTPTGGTVVARWPLSVPAGEYRLAIALTLALAGADGAPAVRSLALRRTIELTDDGTARVDLRMAIDEEAERPTPDGPTADQPPASSR